MPSRSTETRCFCIQCTQQGGLDASDKPKGMMILSRHLSAHLARVQAEQEAIAAGEREAVEARLVALTLTDDGPMDQPSKLWASRDEFQQDVSHTIHLPDHSATPPINDILEGVSRLSLPRPSTDHVGPSNATSVPSALMPRSVPGSSHSHTRTNRRTTKVLQVLDQMDMKIGVCVAKLSGTPTVSILREVESTLNLLHPGLAKVTRRAPSIDMRKRQIIEQLVSLEAVVAKWTCILDAKEPVPYNCGE